MGSVSARLRRGSGPRPASTGLWAADNNAEIFVNGTKVLERDNFISLAEFSITTNFVPGLNTLEFRVENSICGEPCTNPTGLLVTCMAGNAPILAPEVPALGASGTAILAGVLILGGWLGARRLS